MYKEIIKKIILLLAKPEVAWPQFMREGFTNKQILKQFLLSFDGSGICLENHSGGDISSSSGLPHSCIDSTWFGLFWLFVGVILPSSVCFEDFDAEKIQHYTNKRTVFYCDWIRTGDRVFAVHCNSCYAQLFLSLDFLFIHGIFTLGSSRICF